MKNIFKISAIVAAMFATSCSGDKNFSKADREIIHTNPQELLHIYTVDNPEELEVLRKPSWNLTAEAIHSDDFKLLAERMIRTVSDSTAGGVGLAAPQIGINKAVIVVQRVDKEGAPYEVYPNARIVTRSEELDISIEGCLSIPGKRDYVDRSMGIVVEYYSIPERKMVQDTIIQYASIIFQHEIDHLEGILYTDRVW